MSDTPSPASDPAPAPSFDHAAYTPVVIVKTDEVDGFLYRRGSKANVDAGTLKVLQDRGMVDSKPAGSTG